jgi:uncharacterized tellurite resistance protein B-like protein
MSLFSTFKKDTDKGNTQFTKEEAVAGVLFAVVASDGNIGEEEIDAFNGVANRMNLFKPMAGDQFTAMMQRLADILHQEDVVVLFRRSLQSVPEDLRETVFATAVDLVLADGEVDDNEQSILFDLKEALTISDELAERIIEVMMIRHRG